MQRTPRLLGGCRPLLAHYDWPRAFGLLRSKIPLISRAILRSVSMEPYERLKIAREAAGYETAEAAAQAFGWNPVTYRAHENGRNGMRTAVARKYARAYMVNVEWLLFNKHQMKTDQPDPGLAELTENYHNLTPKERKGLVDLSRTLASETERGS